MSTAAAYAPSADAVVAALGTDAGTGLTARQAAQRLAEVGPNELPRESGPGRLRMLLGQLRNPLIYVLLVAGAITALFGSYPDAGVIFGVVVLNAAIGYVQEAKAGRALAALATLVRTETTVVRDGQTTRMPASALVPGDVVLLVAGDRVPADARLVESHELSVDESTLTGESEPVAKAPGPVAPETPVADRAAMIHSGTIVTRGTARAVVVATGSATQLGMIGELVAGTVAAPTPLTRKLGGFAGRLSVVIVAAAVVTFALGLLRGAPVVEMFTAAVALAVGAIPEGLPAAVSIVLAIGVVRMARRNTVVRTLPAAETLGATTVICTDKTGTLTLNRMTVTAVSAAGRTAEPSAVDGRAREVLRAGVLCNDAVAATDPGHPATGDPTETALLEAARAAGADPVVLRADAPRTAVLPFDSGRRLMVTAHGTDEGFVKGAVEEVVRRCHKALAPDGTEILVDSEAIATEHRKLMARGLRVLAFAKFTPDGTDLADRIDRGDLVFLGLQGMHDPPRPAARAAVAACRRAGIAVKMITGDHPGTARAVAAAVGLLDPAERADALVLTGAQLDRLPDADLGGAADEARVFARVSPEQKLRLVAALRARGHIVAMTGDGVNDAPALRSADIGVAMGRGGTEAAREAADMVLTDDDFASVEAAVEEGRGVFDNLRKFIAWTVPANVGEGFVILAAIVAGATLPILPVQILWINMTTAVFLGLSLAFEPKAPDIMDRPPRDPDRPLLTRSLLRRTVVVSVLLALVAFGCHAWELAHGATEATARTVAVDAFVSVQIVYLISCRDLDRGVFARPRRRANPMVWLGIAITAGLQLLMTYAPVMQTLFHTTPIGASAWWLIAVAGAVALVVVELDKWVWHRHGTVAGPSGPEQGRRSLPEGIQGSGDRRR